MSLLTIADFVGPAAPGLNGAGLGADRTAPALNINGGDWTHAIQLMAAATYDGSIYGQGFVQLPWGSGLFNGTPLNYINTVVHGVGMAHTKLTCNSPFINVPTVGIFELADFSIFYGNNPIQVGTATDASGSLRTVQRINFQGCTGTAFKATGNDTPNFHMDLVTINMGANGIGFDFAGWMDQCTITRCNFTAYKIALHFGSSGRLPNNCNVGNGNNFMHVGTSGDPSAEPRYDCWIEPQATELQAGQGFRFHGNRHGNEPGGFGTGPARKRIVFAAASGGLPDITHASAGFICGVSIYDNDVYYADTADAYIFTTTDHLLFNSFGWGCTQGVGSSALANAPMLQSLSGAHTAQADWNTNLLYDWRGRYHVQGTTPISGTGQNQNPTPIPVSTPPAVTPWWWWI